MRLSTHKIADHVNAKTAGPDPLCGRNSVARRWALRHNRPSPTRSRMELSRGEAQLRRSSTRMGPIGADRNRGKTQSARCSIGVGLSRGGVGSAQSIRGSIGAVLNRGGYQSGFNLVGVGIRGKGSQSRYKRDNAQWGGSQYGWGQVVANPNPIHLRAHEVLRRFPFVANFEVNSPSAPCDQARRNDHFLASNILGPP